jgi:hypothetical protein
MVREKAISISWDFQDFDFSNEGFDDTFAHCDVFGNLFFSWHAVVGFYVFGWVSLLDGFDDCYVELIGIL